MLQAILGDANAVLKSRLNVYYYSLILLSERKNVT